MGGCRDAEIRYPSLIFGDFPAISENFGSFFLLSGSFADLESQPLVKNASFLRYQLKIVTILNYQSARSSRAKKIANYPSAVKRLPSQSV